THVPQHHVCPALQSLHGWRLHHYEAPTTFDDQYRGCTHAMERSWGILDPGCCRMAELRGVQGPPDAWAAERACGGPPGIDPSYTLHTTLSHEFNWAMHEAGRSHREHLDKFHLKVLHFLLTQAMSTLRKAQSNHGHQVYVGIHDIHFTTQRQDLSALDFGGDTFFSVYTCYSVPIRDFSFYPDEDEVLIPPFGRFKVTNITKHGDRACIQLHSWDTFSTYNCEWMKGDIPCDAPSIPSIDPQSTGMVPPSPRTVSSSPEMVPPSSGTVPVPPYPG
uniref:NAD(P)(+)--arginine ADP-ribosyltransferase n=1 Tax=Calidris pygmaea TaxID=425635 RepID=A0A8C3JSJ5_9CHAR